MSAGVSVSDQLWFLWDMLPNLLWGFPGHRPGGLLMSILLSGAALGVGLFGAVVLSLMHHSRLGPVRWLAALFVWVVRGVPLLVQLVLVHHVVGGGRLPWIDTSTLGSALIALTMYSSVYLGDVLQAAIRAVPQQLIDSDRVLGASRSQVHRMTTLPWALRTARPGFVTQMITVFKDSSVVVVLGVADLTTNARIALGSDVGNAPYWVSLYLLVGALYFAVAWGLSHLALRSVTGHAPRARSSFGPEASDDSPSLTRHRT